MHGRDRMLTPTPTDENPQGPPQAPDIAPRVHFSVAQRIAFLVLVLIPLLSLAGAFGERMSETHGERGALLVHAAVPARLRYRQRMTLDITVLNRSGRAIDDVRVHIDSTYLDRFSAVSISPLLSPDGAVHFGIIGPASSVLMTATLEGDRSGMIRGDAIVTDAQGDTVRLPLGSRVFP